MPQDKLTPSMAITSLRTSLKGSCLTAEGACVTRLRGGGRFDTSKVRIDIPAKEDAVRISFGSRYGLRLPKGYAINRFRMEIDVDEAEEWDIQNKLLLNYDGQGENRISYSLKDRRTGTNHNSEIYLRGGRAMYFRQNINNSIIFTIRDACEYDTPEGQARIEKAWRESKALKGSDIVMMYEKNCSRYEESASVLYEKLIDEGYDNVYYVVDTSIPAVQALPDKYKKNLIERDSDKHLQYYFASDRFISTETMDHAVHLRIANKRVLDKATGGGLMYVFLQHGVMYMVSLNSSLRSGFRVKKNYKLHRTVVSSEAEARHFIDLAGMKPEDLYVTGLAKFDRCYMNEGADKIVIMPTWRRWETNQAKKDVEGTGYYRMIETMYKAVPEELRDKVVILPHPLMAERFKSEEGGLGGSILLADSYDEVLRDCSLLITDYSSIAYDAFYRGANVVFWWRDKDECMKHYGEGSYLMLNEGNVFGPVCMEPDEITKAVRELYRKPQTPESKEKYSKIVEFHDGRNSDRIIDKLKEDGVI